jgi:hypothetical protein
MCATGNKHGSAVRAKNQTLHTLRAHDERTGLTAHQRIWIASSADPAVCINFDLQPVDGIAHNSLGLWHVC